MWKSKFEGVSWKDNYFYTKNIDFFVWSTFCESKLESNIDLLEKLGWIVSWMLIYVTHYLY